MGVARRLAPRCVHRKLALTERNRKNPRPGRIPTPPRPRPGLRAADLNTGRGGDLVVAIDGRPVRDFNELNSYLGFSTEPGQTIELTVLRGGDEVRLSLTLGARP